MLIMERDELIAKIISKYYADRHQIQDWQKENSTELKQYKNGVYLFFDASGNALYIGMVSNSETASLYARIHANGNAKHSIKKWYNEIAKVFFYQMSACEKGSIMILERILIRELKPLYNDLDFDEDEINVVLENM